MYWLYTFYGARSARIQWAIWHFYMALGCYCIAYNLGDHAENADPDTMMIMASRGIHGTR